MKNPSSLEASVHSSERGVNRRALGGLGEEGRGEHDVEPAEEGRQARAADLASWG